MQTDPSIQILSDLTVYAKYARFIPELNRRETWAENSNRVEEMHVRKYPQYESIIREAFEYDRDKIAVASMRSHQFGGKAIEQNNARLYNCSFLNITRYQDFAEIMFLLLSGTGVGYSVRSRHISKLPTIQEPKRGKRFVIGDSIEGWSDAIRALCKAYLFGAYLPLFDYTDIRPKGSALKTSGGKAPGPEPLRRCIENIDHLFRSKTPGHALTSLEVHDIVCFIADAVLSGGIRRAALICLFDSNDIDMITCKGNFPAEIIEVQKRPGATYMVKVRLHNRDHDVLLSDWDFKTFVANGTLPWYHFYPQRARANNSVTFYREDWYGEPMDPQPLGLDSPELSEYDRNFLHTALKKNPINDLWYATYDGEFIPATTEDEFKSVWELCKASGAGEPGVFWTNHPDWGCNPCGEIALRGNSVAKDGTYTGPGGQFCNLTSINLTACKSQNDLMKAVKAATIIGTLQASYTDFHYLDDGWRKNCEEEALLGLSLTGIGDVAYTDYDFAMASEYAKEINEWFAGLIGINPAARICTVKPEGTLSLVCGSSSGVHARHAPYYLRRMRFNKNEPIAQYLMIRHEALVEDDKFNPNGVVVTIPQRSPKTSIFRTESAIDTLERVRFFNAQWVRPSHRSGENYHNVSCTISVKTGGDEDEWGAVGRWMWDNRDVYTGIAVLPFDGHTYVQAPFEDCDKETFDRMYAVLKTVDLTEVWEAGDNTDLKDQAACSSGACEVV